MTVKKPNLTSVDIRSSRSSYLARRASADAAVGEKRRGLVQKALAKPAPTGGYYQCYLKICLLQHLILTTYNIDRRIRY